MSDHVAFKTSSQLIRLFGWRSFNQETWSWFPSNCHFIFRVVPLHLRVVEGRDAAHFLHKLVHERDLKASIFQYQVLHKDLYLQSHVRLHSHSLLLLMMSILPILKKGMCFRQVFVLRFSVSNVSIDSLFWPCSISVCLLFCLSFWILIFVRVLLGCKSHREGFLKIMFPRKLGKPFFSFFIRAAS